MIFELNTSNVTYVKLGVRVDSARNLRNQSRGRATKASSPRFRPDCLSRPLHPHPIHPTPLRAAFLSASHSSATAGGRNAECLRSPPRVVNGTSSCIGSRQRARQTADVSVRSTLKRHRSRLRVHRMHSKVPSEALRVGSDVLGSTNESAKGASNTPRRAVGGGSLKAARNCRPSWLCALLRHAHRPRWIRANRNNQKPAFRGLWAKRDWPFVRPSSFYAID